MDKKTKLFDETRWTRFGSAEEFSKDHQDRMPFNWNNGQTVTSQKWVTAGHNKNVNVANPKDKKYARGVHIELPSVNTLKSKGEEISTWDQDEDIGKKPKGNYVVIKPHTEKENMAFGGVDFLKKLNTVAKWKSINW